MILLGSSVQIIGKSEKMMTIKKDLYTYEIEIVETMSAIIEVIAEDDSSAILEARERYRNEEIELNYDDLIDTKFNIFGVEWMILAKLNHLTR